MTTQFFIHLYAKWRKVSHPERAERDPAISSYKGEKVGRKRVDFIIDEVMVEIKAKGELEPVDFVQTLSYLKASGYKVGLLLNFGATRLEIKRIVN